MQFERHHEHTEFTNRFCQFKEAVFPNQTLQPVKASATSIEVTEPKSRSFSPARRTERACDAQ